MATLGFFLIFFLFQIYTIYYIICINQMGCTHSTPANQMIGLWVLHKSPEFSEEGRYIASVSSIHTYRAWVLLHDYTWTWTDESLIQKYFSPFPNRCSLGIGKTGLALLMLILSPSPPLSLCGLVIGPYWSLPFPQVRVSIKQCPAASPLYPLTQQRIPQENNTDPHKA